MLRWRGGSARWAFVVVVALAITATVRSERDAAEWVPVSLGVFSAEQADAGRVAYGRHCSECHGVALGGGYGPSLAPLDRFAFRDAPLSRLFDVIRLEMPFDAPGSLDDETYASILAHVLRTNGYPSGPDPLPTDPEAHTGFLLDAPAD